MPMILKKFQNHGLKHLLNYIHWIIKVGLEDLGKPYGYIDRQIEIWSKQYQMLKLMKFNLRIKNH